MLKQTTNQNRGMLLPLLGGKVLGQFSLYIIITIIIILACGGGFS